MRTIYTLKILCYEVFIFGSSEFLMKRCPRPVKASSCTVGRPVVGIALICIKYFPLKLLFVGSKAAMFNGPYATPSFNS